MIVIASLLIRHLLRILTPLPAPRCLVVAVAVLVSEEAANALGRDFLYASTSTLTVMYTSIRRLSPMADNYRCSYIGIWLAILRRYAIELKARMNR